MPNGVGCDQPFRFTATISPLNTPGSADAGLKNKPFSPLDLVDLDDLSELSVLPPVLLLEPQLVTAIVNTTNEKNQTNFLFRL
jgi:hypothetical protein